MENIEIWRDIPNYEGLYQVSNMGQVKSFKRKGNYKDRILKQEKQKNEYLRVDLSKNGKVKHFLVHKLVALTFIPNDYPTEKTQVNHLDENKENNHVSNLCWCSCIENCNYGTRNERVSKTHKGKPKYKHRKPIQQYTKDMVFIRDWDSTKSASLELKIDNGCICKCCQNKRKTAGGFIWRYKE